MKRHTVHILIGEQVKALEEMLYGYIYRRGNAGDDDFVKLYSTAKKGKGMRLTRYTPSGGGEEQELTVQWLTGLFNDTHNIQNGDPYTDMYMCLYMPLYDKECYDCVKNIVDVAGRCAGSVKFRIDVFGFADDLAPVLGNAKGEANLGAVQSKVLEGLVNDEKENRIGRLVLMRSVNEKGSALNLDAATLAYVVGQHISLTSDNFEAVYPSNVYTQPEVTTFGLSALLFDRSSFVEYLMHKAYVYILEREGVEVSVIDSAKVSQLATERLKGAEKLFEDFYNTEVLPCQMDATLSDNQRSAKINDSVKLWLEREEHSLKSLYEDDGRSLPEKRAIMAQLIGVDDELLEGAQMPTDMPIVDDYYSGPVKEFLDEDNANVTIEGTEKNPVGKGGQLPGSNESLGGNEYLLPKVKEVTNRIKQRTATIRKAAARIRELEQQMEVSQQVDGVLTEGGFVYHGVVYRTLDNVDPRPLEEDYQPACEQAADSVDLRASFGAIRDQGPIGACVAFASVGALEYMMGRGSEEEGLSPRFIYYHVAGRDESGQRVDRGSSYYDVLHHLADKGTCLEKLAPYSTLINDIWQEPSADAFADALGHRALVSKNVKVDHEYITKALTEGFPVMISMRLFDGFATNQGGFVFRPSADEMASADEHWHAMVIVGYSKDAPVYIVRNSWGRQFGDEGYCYVPFSYIEDPQLCREAYVITEVSGTQRVVDLAHRGRTVEFNHADRSTEYALLRLQCEQEEAELQHDIALRERLKRNHLDMVIRLTNPTVRAAIEAGGRTRREARLADLQQRYSNLLDGERSRRLASRRKFNIFSYVCLGLVLLMSVVWRIVISIHNTTALLLDPKQVVDVPKWLQKWSHPDMVFGVPWWVYLLSVCCAVGLSVLLGVVLSKRSQLSRMIETEEQAKKHNSDVTSLYVHKRDRLHLLFFALMVGAMILLNVWIIVAMLLYRETLWPSIWMSTLNIVLSLLAVVISVPYLAVRYLKLKRQLDAEMEDLQQQIQRATIDLQHYPIRMYAAGRIIEEVQKLRSSVEDLYLKMRSFLGNLRVWLDEERNKVGEGIYTYHAPLECIISKDVLDTYFEQQKDALTSQVKLYRALPDFRPDEAGLRTLKTETLRKMVQEAIEAPLSSFSMYDYLIEQKNYPFLPPLGSVTELISRMGERSVPFAPFTSLDISWLPPRQCLLMHSPGGANWRQEIVRHFTIPPTVDEVADRNVLVLFAQRELKLKELN